jgi:hypothetical protein
MDLKALIENNRRNKISKLYYLALTDITGAMKVEKMLNMIGKELLPLSNSKQADDEVKYLSFDEALDEIAGEEIPEVNNIEENSREETKHSDVDEELIESLKDDIAGIF